MKGQRLDFSTTDEIRSRASFLFMTKQPEALLKE